MMRDHAPSIAIARKRVECRHCATPARVDEVFIVRHEGHVRTYHDVVVRDDHLHRRVVEDRAPRRTDLGPPMQRGPAGMRAGNSVGELPRRGHRIDVAPLERLIEGVVGPQDGLASYLGVC